MRKNNFRLESIAIHYNAPSCWRQTAGDQQVGISLPIWRRCAEHSSPTRVEYPIGGIRERRFGLRRSVFPQLSNCFENPFPSLRVVVQPAEAPESG